MTWRAAAGIALAVATAGPAGAQLAITHVTVVDVAAGAHRRDMTVVVQGDRITAVQPASQARVPRGSRVVSGRGRFLIPGLWDMHAHVDDHGAWVFAGVPAATVLRAATLEPARYLGATDSLGTIQPGKVADLVLLDGSPPLDIRNTSRIRAVILRGRLIDSVARRRMLDGVAQRAAAQ